MFIVSFNFGKPAVKNGIIFLGLFLIKDQGFELKEHAPGWTIGEIQDLTEAQLSVATDLKEFQLRY